METERGVGLAGRGIGGGQSGITVAQHDLRLTETVHHGDRDLESVVAALFQAACAASSATSGDSDL